MIAFLVFSDWANPSLTTIEKTDGTKMKVAVLLETTDMLRVQIEEPVGEPEERRQAGHPKTQIASKVPDAPAGYEWASWIYVNRWYFAFAFLAATLFMAWGWFDREEINDWLGQTWGFAKSIIPLLFGGVFVTGFVGALIPEQLVASWVGGNSFAANLVASVIGAMWYFATLTEIPILEALHWLGNGTWAGAGLAAGRSGIVVTKHRGHLQCDWLQEDLRSLCSLPW